MADVQALTATEFEQAGGTEDWRVLPDGVAGAYFVTGGFSRGAAFVSRMAELADAANHHPDVDLRFPGLTVRLFTHDTDSLTERDVDLARQISGLAGELGIEADVSKLG